MEGKLATVFGASGFLGRYVVYELARRGWRVRAAVRRPHLANDLRVAGLPGQVQISSANIRMPASVADAVAGADVVVNLVGILKVTGKQDFDGVQHKGAATIAKATAEAGADDLIQVSAIGADPSSKSAYARTKAEGEEAVRQAFPEAVILRPSVVFGPGDDFFNRFAKMATLSPALPLVNFGKTRFQPVYVRDVAEALANALERQDARGRTFELGGPEVYTFKEILKIIMDVTQRPRLLAPLPMSMTKAMGASVGWVPGAPITLDQARLLERDNVVSSDMPGLRDLDVEPTAVETIVPTYLYRFRKHGQFTQPQDSPPMR
jgi:NADH dehydrogenase